jgi:hypothetical protein
VIIGVTGHYQAGKDSVGKALAKLGYKQVALADNVRKAAMLIDPLVFVDATGNGVLLSELVNAVGWEAAKKYNSVRRLLQVLGTEIGREMFGADSWIEMLKLDGDSVITDVRFYNESDWIHKQGGKVFRVVRPGYNGDNHKSESQIDFLYTDAEIENDGTLDDLEKKVLALMEKQ